MKVHYKRGKIICTKQTYTIRDQSVQRTATGVKVEVTCLKCLKILKIDRDLDS